MLWKILILLLTVPFAVLAGILASLILGGWDE